MTPPDPAGSRDRMRRLRARLGTLAYGGDYNPEQWPEETWLEDLRLMREAGVNLVSVGVFSWGRLEPRPGVHHFGWLDRLLDLLAEHGVGANLATPTAAPPAWLAHEHPETLPVDAEGRRVAFGARQHYCPSSPVFRHHAADITERLAERYAGHPALAMWHIGNEYPGLAYCHCEVSAAHFRRWLAERYGTVDALNAAWGTAFWGQHYDSFDWIEPPRGRLLGGPNPGHHLDFVRFSGDESLACFTAERDIVRRHTPDIPVATNFMGGFKQLDYWRWAAEEDVVALDIYPNSWDQEGQVFAAYNFDLMRSLRGGEPWLLMESATGPNVQRRRNSARPAGQLRPRSLQAVARGADSVMFFQWRESRVGAERYHSAMLPHGGTRTRVWREVRELGGELPRLAGLAGGRVAAETAVVWDWDAWWAVELPGHPSVDLDFRARVLEHYRPLWHANVPVDFVPPGADLSGYRLVVVPSLYLVDDAGAKNLTEFVRDGGHLVMSYFSGIADEHDRVRAGGHPGAFREVLGLLVEEFSPLQPDETRGLEHAGRVGVAGEWQDVILLDGAEAIAAYTEGEYRGRPAVTRHRFGAGTATYLGTSPDPDTMGALLLDAVRQAGVTPVLETPDGVEAVRRCAEDGTDHLFLLNHTDRPREVALPPVAGPDLLGGAPPDGGVLRLDPYRVAVFPEPTSR
ncbi:beta-galactosidase [Streptomyces mayteni]